MVMNNPRMISPTTLLFQIIGIDISPTAPSRCCSILMVASMPIINAIYIKELHSGIQNLIHGEDMDAYMYHIETALTLSVTLSLFLWYALLYKKSHIKTVLKTLVPTSSTNFPIYNNVIVTYSLYFLVAFALVLLPIGTTIGSMYHCGEIDKPILELLYPSFFNTILWHYSMNLSQVSFAILFTEQLIIFRRLIRTHKQNFVEQGDSLDSVQVCVRTYEQIVDVHRDLETAFSLPTLINFGVNYLFMFIAFAMLLGYQEHGGLSVQMGSAMVLGTMCFLSVSWSASQVEQEDKSLRHVMRKIALKHVKQSNDYHADIMTRLLELTDSIVMTAWGAISLHRSFIIYSFGGIVSYGLLFLQLKNQVSNNSTVSV